MSEMYGFGEESTEQAPDAAVAPKFYREYMDKVSKQLQALQDRNDALEAAQTKQVVRETLTAQGYAPEAANLYTGTPDKLNDWLAANAAALARTGGNAAEGEQQGVTQQGPPETAVSPESQAALAAMNAAAAGGAGPLSGDDQMAARLNAVGDDEAAYNAIMREAGNVRFR